MSVIARPAAALLALCLAAAVPTTAPPAAYAAGETVDIWLTTTSDAGGRTVTRGLQPQAPVSFGPPGGSADQVVAVDENTRYQQFEGAGASITDSAAWLLRGSGIVSAATRDAVMRDLFDPVTASGWGSCATRWAPPTWPATTTASTTPAAT